MTREKVILDREPQLDKLRLDIDTAATQALQSGVGVSDIILTLLVKSDELCQIAEEAGADLSKIAVAFKRTS